MFNKKKTNFIEPKKVEWEDEDSVAYFNRMYENTFNPEGRVTKSSSLIDDKLKETDPTDLYSTLDSLYVNENDFEGYAGDLYRSLENEDLKQKDYLNYPNGTSGTSSDSGNTEEASNGKKKPFYKNISYVSDAVGGGITALSGAVKTYGEWDYALDIHKANKYLKKAENSTDEKEKAEYMKQYEDQKAKAENLLNINNETSQKIGEYGNSFSTTDKKTGNKVIDKANQVIKGGISSLTSMGAGAALTGGNVMTGMGVTSYGNAKNEAENMGVENATQYALINAVIETGSELVLPGSKGLKTLFTTGSLKEALRTAGTDSAQDFLREVAKEYGQESLTELAHIVHEGFYVDGNGEDIGVTSWGEGIDRFNTAGLTGAFMGGVTTGTANLNNKLNGTYEPKAKTIEDDTPTNPFPEVPTKLVDKATNQTISKTMADDINNALGTDAITEDDILNIFSETSKKETENNDDNNISENSLENTAQNLEGTNTPENIQNAKSQGENALEEGVNTEGQNILEDTSPNTPIINKNAPFLSKTIDNGKEVYITEEGNPVNAKLAEMVAENQGIPIETLTKYTAEDSAKIETTAKADRIIDNIDNSIIENGIDETIKAINTDVANGSLSEEAYNTAIQYIEAQNQVTQSDTKQQELTQSDADIQSIGNVENVDNVETVDNTRSVKNIDNIEEVTKNDNKRQEVTNDNFKLTEEEIKVLNDKVKEKVYEVVRKNRTSLESIKEYSNGDVYISTENSGYSKRINKNGDIVENADKKATITKTYKNKDAYKNYYNSYSIAKRKSDTAVIKQKLLKDMTALYNKKNMATNEETINNIDDEIIELINNSINKDGLFLKEAFSVRDIAKQEVTKNNTADTTNTEANNVRYDSSSSSNTEIKTEIPKKVSKKVRESQEKLDKVTKTKTFKDTFKDTKLKAVEKLNVEQRTAEKLSKEIGRDVVFYEADGKAPNGFFKEDTLFISNSFKGDSLMSVLGHETFHSLKKTDRKTFNELVKWGEENFSTKEINKFLSKIDNEAEIERLSNNPKLLSEEMLAESFGTDFANKEFWNSLEKTNKTLFDKIKDFVFKILKKAENNTNDFLTKKHIKELSAEFESILGKLTDTKTETKKTTSNSKSNQEEASKEIKESSSKTETKESNDNIKESFKESGLNEDALSLIEKSKLKAEEMLDRQRNNPNKRYRQDLIDDATSFLNELKKFSKENIKVDSEGRFTHFFGEYDFIKKMISDEALILSEESGIDYGKAYSNIRKKIVQPYKDYMVNELNIISEDTIKKESDKNKDNPLFKDESYSEIFNAYLKLKTPFEYDEHTGYGLPGILRSESKKQLGNFVKSLEYKFDVKNVKVEANWTDYTAEATINGKDIVFEANQRPNERSLDLTAKIKNSNSSEYYNVEDNIKSINKLLNMIEPNAIKVEKVLAPKNKTDDVKFSTRTEAEIDRIKTPLLEMVGKVNDLQLRTGIKSIYKMGINKNINLVETFKDAINMIASNTDDAITNQKNFEKTLLDKGISARESYILSKYFTNIVEVAKEKVVKPTINPEYIVSTSSNTVSANEVNTNGNSSSTINQVITSTNWKGQKGPLIDRIGVGIERAYSRIADTFHFAKKIAGDDVYRKARLTNTSFGIAENILTNNLTDKNGNVVDASLKDMLAEVMTEGKELEIMDYSLHKHNMDRATQEKYVFYTEDGTPVSSAQSSEIVAKYEAKNPDFKAKAERLTGWINTFMKAWGVDTGILSEDLYNVMLNMYPSYVPTNRELNDHLEFFGGSYGGKGFVDKSKPVKKLAEGGSARNIIDIRESLVNLVTKTVRTAKMNEVGQSLLQAIRTNPEMEGVASIVSKPEGDNPNVVRVLEKGEAVYVEIHNQDLLNMLEKVHTPEYGDITEAVKTINNGVKQLITAKNPLFALTNTARDYQTYMVNSSEVNLKKRWSNLQEALSLIQQDIAGKDMTGTKLALYNAMGVNASGIMAKSSHKTLENMTGRKALINQNTGAIEGYTDIGGFKKNWTKIMDGLETLTGSTETAFRLAEFIGAINRGESIEEATLKSMEVTVDFSRGGDITKQADAYVKYLNAGVQGLDNFVRNVAKNPARVLTRSLVHIAGPALILAAFNSGDDEYEMLDDRTKDNNFLISLKVFGKEGQFIKIPKAREYGMVAMLAERLVYGRGFNNLGRSIWENVSPPSPISDNILSDIGKYGDDEAKDFAGRYIVPSALQEYDKKDQWDEDTTVLSKWLGQITGLSPKKLDYYLDSYSGILGDSIMPMFTPSTYTNKEDVLSKSTSFITNKFVADNTRSSSSSSDYYDNLDKMTKIVNNEQRDMTTEEKQKYKSETEEIKNYIEDKYGKDIAGLNKKLKDKTLTKEEIKEIKKMRNEAMKKANETAKMFLSPKK